jgi:hypothetical protein
LFLEKSEGAFGDSDIRFIVLFCDSISLLGVLHQLLL